MRAFWRGDKPLHSHAEWRGKLGKNSKQGTSAPTLAAVWGGPVELMGALRHQPEFEALRLTHVVVEAQSSVDEFSGPRNHDLVARGELPSGERCGHLRRNQSGGELWRNRQAADFSSRSRQGSRGESRQDQQSTRATRGAARTLRQLSNVGTEGAEHALPTADRVGRDAVRGRGARRAARGPDGPGLPHRPAPQRVEPLQ